jgi:hypothetical protein
LKVKPLGSYLISEAGLEFSNPGVISSLQYIYVTSYSDLPDIGKFKNRQFYPEQAFEVVFQSKLRTQIESFIPG